MKYYARQSGSEYGPMNERELKTLVMLGQISGSGEVRSDGSVEWKPANEISIIGHLLKPEITGDGKASDRLMVSESATSPSETNVDSVKVVDIDMPFGSMVVFMVKWALASIPAIFILSIVLGIVMWFASQIARQ